MHTDIVDLREFYLSSLGLTVRRVLRTRLCSIWPSLRGEHIVALGYATPLLRPLLGEAGRLTALMPASQGVAYWPREGPNISCLVDTANLPLMDDTVDRIILLHAFEGVQDPQLLLREVHRVLKSNGRLLMIVPNRRGLWAHSDRTPFGHGQPYSAGQIRKALHDEGFLIDRTWGSLYFPPTASRLILSLADFLEKWAERLLPGFGGLLLIEAGKQLYSPLPAKVNSSQRRLILPLPLPAGTPPAIPVG